MSDDDFEIEDNGFSALLDILNRAVEEGDATQFWDTHPVSAETRDRLEVALHNINLVKKFYESQKSQSTIVDRAALQEWTVTLDRFKIGEELGRGGFGIVYLAEDLRLKRKVAVKIPRLEAMRHSSWRQRFLREAEVMARLEHPHIVPIYEVGDSGDSVFVVSQYCPGVNLMQWLEANPNQLNADQVAALVACLGEALAYCHEKGVLHRDLKPANVLLFPEKHNSLPFMPRLNDFGLAKFMEHDLNLTTGSGLLGTPPYMSPELIQSDDVNQVGPSSDLFSLGVMMYELLVGERPFSSNKLAVILDQVRHTEPKAPRNAKPTIPIDLETICLKCLRKDTRERYQSAEELVSDLRLFLSNKPIAARRIGLFRRLSAWYLKLERIPQVAMFCLVVALILAAVIPLQSFLQLSGAFSTPVDPVSLQPNSGIEFSTEINRIFIAKNSFDGSMPVTLEAWIKPKHPKGMIANLNGIISIFSDSGAEGVGPQVVVHLAEDRMVYYNSLEPLTPDVWHHLAAVFDGRHMKLFVDGEEAICEIYIDNEITAEQQSESPELKLHTIWQTIGFVIGSNAPSATVARLYPFQGRIASLMVSREAKYTKSFKPERNLTATDQADAHYIFNSDSDLIEDVLGKSSPAFRKPLFRR